MFYLKTQKSFPSGDGFTQQRERIYSSTDRPKTNGGIDKLHLFTVIKMEMLQKLQTLSVKLFLNWCHLIHKVSHETILLK